MWLNLKVGQTFEFTGPAGFGPDDTKAGTKVELMFWDGRSAEFKEINWGRSYVCSAESVDRLMRKGLLVGWKQEDQMKHEEYHVVLQLAGQPASEDAIDFTEAKKQAQDITAFCDFVNQYLVDYVNIRIGRFEETNEVGCQNIVVHIPKKLASSANVRECEWRHPKTDEHIEIKCDATDENITITADRAQELGLSGKKVMLRTSLQNKARFELEKVASQCHPEDLRKFCERTLESMGVQHVAGT